MKRPTITGVRPLTDADRARRAEFGFDTPDSVTAIATDSSGTTFLGDTEAEALALAEQHHAPRRRQDRSAA